MKVLSLFDGIGGAGECLRSAGFDGVELYTSEICEKSKSLSLLHNPKSIQLGDVKNVRGGDYDLIIAGSPCQGFSYAGKRLNFDDPRSSLFFEFVRVLEESRKINPNVKFMLENVSMKKEWEEKITEILLVNPVKICASKYTAFKRKRNYWFNWDCDEINVKSISSFKELTGGKPCAITGRKIDDEGNRRDYSDFPTVQCVEISVGDKGRCVTTVSKDSCVYMGEQSKGRIIDAYGANRHLWRNISTSELSIGHGYSDGYFDSVSDNFAAKAIGNGWSIQVVSAIIATIKG